MKKTLVAVTFVVLSGCATPPPTAAPCPPLPELPARMTPTQQAAYTTLFVRMYAQCAERRP